MSAHVVVVMFHKYPAFVFQKFLRHHHEARDGASRVDLCLHVLHPLHLSVLQHTDPAIRVHRYADAVPSTVHADPHGVARLLLPHERLAGLVGDAGEVRVAIRVAGISSGAGPRGAVDHHLAGQLHHGPGPVALQQEPVGEGGGGGLRPAGVAELGGVLVADGGGEVAAVDGAQIVREGQRGQVHVGPGERADDHLAVPRPVGGVSAGGEGLGTSPGRPGGCGGVEGSVGGHGVGAARLDAQHVGAAEDAHVPTLPPVASPAVAHDPVGQIVLHAPPHHAHVLLEEHARPALGEHPMTVVQQLGGHSDAAGDRSVGIDLTHHRIDAREVTVAIDVVGGIGGDGLAGTVLKTRATDVLRIATLLNPSVGHATLSRNSVVSNIPIGRNYIPSIAAT